MNVGDLIKFKKTGVTAMIIKKTDEGCNQRAWLELYVGDGALDNTPSSSGFTGMSLAMAKRTAEVIDESR
tara:strand:- start:71 stop:280 length:210 start_codon:yes stop_codon:yes gene_type:complete